MIIYYSVIIPYVEKGRTVWHPTENTGPFKTLVRGGWKTRAEAIAWARAHLDGNPYSIRASWSGLCLPMPYFRERDRKFPRSPITITV